MAPEQDRQPPEKFDLNEMLKEIEDDMAAEAADFRQEADISQAVITKLMIENVKKKKGPDA